MYCIIVKRGNLEDYDMLYKIFNEKMPVLLERRHGDRRRTPVPPPNTQDRRQKERRGAAPPSWVALGFVVAERHARS